MEIEQGQLYRHDFGPRTNHLQDGPRPVLVVQTDLLNRIEGYPNVVIVPLTTKQRASATYVKVAPSREDGLTEPSWVIANQIFTVDKSELRGPIGRVSKSDIYAVKTALRITLDLGG